MNTAFASYPRLGNDDFECAIESPQSFKVTEVCPSCTLANGLTAFAFPGFAESVHRVVEKKALNLSAPLFQRVMALSFLDKNWDGEGARAVKPYVLADVVETLNRFSQRTENFQEPFLTPTFDGFIQMEWHDEKRSLDIEAVNQGWFFVGTMIGNDGKRHYFEAECERADFGKLKQFYEWYRGSSQPAEFELVLELNF